MERRMFEGRLKDAWNIPHRNRSKYKLTFYLKSGLVMGEVIGVPDPVAENLAKRRDEIIEANRADFYRPMFHPVEWNSDRRPIRWAPTLDPKTGVQLTDCQILKVTALFLGADI